MAIKPAVTEALAELPRRGVPVDSGGPLPHLLLLAGGAGTSVAEPPAVEAAVAELSEKQAALAMSLAAQHA